MESTRECRKIKGEIMKNRRYGIILSFFVLVFLCAYGSAYAEKSLAEIYKTGKVRFIKRVIIEGDRSYPGREKIKNRSFCIVESDKDGYQKIVKYRIE